ncbi:MAG: hypothetical protein OXF88_21575, partial [Rhodobacteraceae bacterium]|nr:hypothetical protein [Paracoccaceae bacterium]
MPHSFQIRSDDQDYLETGPSSETRYGMIPPASTANFLPVVHCHIGPTNHLGAGIEAYRGIQGRTWYTGDSGAKPLIEFNAAWPRMGIPSAARGRDRDHSSTLVAGQKWDELFDIDADP